MVLILLVGCSNLEVTKRVDEYKAYFVPRLGIATRDTIVNKFGPPQKETLIGSIRWWQYHLGYGTTGNILTSGGVGVSDRWEKYDDITLSFDSLGVLKSWKVWVQR